LEQDETEPNMDNLTKLKNTTFDKITEKRKVWHSFAYAHANHLLFGSQKENYDMHGHVGFAWGAKREVLEKVPLYDKALIGGADHIIAHAAVGEIPCSCIRKTFTEDIDNVEAWMKKFHSVCNNNIGYVNGDLYHIWHGDIEKRDYYNRVKKFTPISKSIQHRDTNGFYTTNPTVDTQVREYFVTREVETDVNFFDSTVNVFVTTIPNEDVTVNDNFTGFGGGDFGGGGAGGEWGEADVNSENFS
jgi:hypothetical protein